MITRLIGGALGRAIGRQNGNHPIAGTLIGAGALMAAKRLLPQRYAFLAATVAAGYLTKKWAERAETRQKSEAAHRADPALADAGVVDPYAGTADVPAAGESIGDALPPTLPVREKKKRPAIH